MARRKATQGDKAVQVVTDPEGRYLLADLPDGTWTIQVDMPGFETLRKDVTLPQETAVAEWALKMRPLDDLEGRRSSGFPAPAPSTGPQLETSSSASSAEANDRLLINGSVISSNSRVTNMPLGFNAVAIDIRPSRIKR